jgi:hypothetical protein
MQPIKTTNAMNPAPAKGIQSLPTPVIDDVIITETVNAWKGDYQKLEYGTKWDSVPHGSQQGSFPEHKLVFQQTSSEDGQWVKRIWANDRVNQDSYNYAIKYSAGSQAHPIYIRTYVLPRETYSPIPDGTPDPLFPSALLVDEEATRIEGELDSKYITVTRAYETIPGPAVPTRRYNERGDLETVIVQTVPPNTPPDPDGLLVTGSQVEQVETGKGVKTTSTVPDHSLLLIKEKKEGLLGETVTTDDIVAPSTNPDTLSQTIVSSVVEQFSATKARKRTTTSTGPTSLSQKNKDGKLLGDITATETIVAPSTNPDAVSTSVLSSEVRQIDAGKAVKKNTILNSTPSFSGNQNEQGLLGVKSTTESIVAAGASADALSLSVISSIIEPIDSVRSRKVTITSSEPQSLLGAEKKEGLLGETNVKESIVASGSSPDLLSETVISSVVEPIDSAKSKKTTVTSTGPTSLSQKNKDGKLLGDVVSVKSIVAPSTNPDAVSSSIISSEVNQIDSGKAIKTNVLLISTPTLSGNQNEQGLLGNKTTSETIVSAGASADVLSKTVISSVIEPIDSVRSKKTTVQSNGPNTLSGGGKKEGLLGETNITETIVDANSSPDNLSINIISSTVEPIDSAKSKKTTITSFGPTVLIGERINQRGEIETVTETIVLANTPADADSLNQTSSEVEPIDIAKSKKTTVEVASRATLLGSKNSAGLLGNTRITETIVPNGALADVLSLNVLSSSVEPISAAKAKKTTVTSTGPKKLSTDSLIESQLGLVNSSNEKSIVDPTTVPSNGLLVVKDSISVLDEVKSERERVTVKGWPTNTSVDWDEQTGIGVYYTEKIIDPSTYTNSPTWQSLLNTEYKAIDEFKSLEKKIDIGKIDNALTNQYYKISIGVPVTMPDKLLSVKVYLSNSYGAGSDFDISQGANTGSYNLSNSGSSKSSWSIGGDIYFEVENGFDGTVEGEKHIFFLKISDGKIAQNSIINALNNNAQFGTTVNEPQPNINPGATGPNISLLENPNQTYQEWPYIKTKTENIILITGGRSLSSSKSESQSVGINGFASSSGTGQSYDVNVSANSILVPKTIHPAITIQTEIINTADDIKGIGQPSYGVRPLTLAATTPAVFPTGKYLISADVELYKWGFVKVTAITATITTKQI